MTEGMRIEIIHPDGSVQSLDRRSPSRGLPAYGRSAGRKTDEPAQDRRRRRRIPDETLRGRVLDIEG